MRLGTCVALELCVAVGATGAVYVGVGRATELAGRYLEARPAAAATVGTTRPMQLPHAHLDVRTEVPRVDSVFGATDAELLAPLGDAKVTALKLNRGGTSLSLRLDFANGARAAFKPEQTHPQSDPRREIAAYRIDRLLGLGRVPPAKATSIAVADLLEATQPSHRTFVAERLAEEAIARGGMLRGELSWWVPDIKLATLGKHRIDEDEGRLLWRNYLKQGATIPEDERAMVAQISAIILYDVLIDNPDRWTGSNTVMSPDGAILYFMDNTMSFSRFAFGHERNVLNLRRMERFPRGLVDKLRALTLEQVEKALVVEDDHGLGPLLQPDEVAAILARRDNLLKHVDKMVEEYGEAAVYAFP
ncbi:MAG: hypothetical protein SFX73_20555 [Kofleriaceae bacterium]|nr:hypothetical protein [Kofleriaceae bacterium]